jgi:pSer/pThr/pTyr-binding forkhead associated (FHA) protein
VAADARELALPAGKREIIIGREDPISGIFPEIDLTPYGGESGGVSRQHARLANLNGQWTITDLNSTNYTYVDGARIEPSAPVPIRDGTQLRFGRVILTFRT